MEDNRRPDRTQSRLKNVKSKTERHDIGSLHLCRGRMGVPVCKDQKAVPESWTAGPGPLTAVCPLPITMLVCQVISQRRTQGLVGNLAADRGHTGQLDVPSITPD